MTSYCRIQGKSKLLKIHFLASLQECLQETWINRTQVSNISVTQTSSKDSIHEAFQFHLWVLIELKYLPKSCRKSICHFLSTMKLAVDGKTSKPLLV